MHLILVYSENQSSLTNLSWKPPAWAVCLVGVLLGIVPNKNGCGVTHILVHLNKIKYIKGGKKRREKKQKRKLSSPETPHFLSAFHHCWDWFCNPCSRDFKGVILLSKGVLSVIPAQTCFMEITCLVRYDSSPASYHVTANNCKFTTSLICTFCLTAFSHVLSTLLCCFFFPLHLLGSGYSSYS